MQTQYSGTGNSGTEGESPFAEEVVAGLKRRRGGRCLPCRNSGPQREWEDPAELEDESRRYDDAAESIDEGERITGMEESPDQGEDTGESEEPVGEGEDISSYVKEVLPKRLAEAEEEYEESTPAPRGLILLDHFQTVSSPDTAQPGVFIAGARKKMEPGQLNPGFIDAGDNLQTDTSASGLQTRLVNLIVQKYSNFLTRASVQNRRASRDDRIRVGLVNLTGERLTKPDFAGWGSTVSMYSASVAKILGLYGAHQLRTDLRQMAADGRITNGADLQKAAVRAWAGRRLTGGLPDLAWFFDIRSWSGSPDSLDFTSRARDAFREIMHNCPAGEIIRRVGFPFIASVTWQSGIWHPARGGLWLRSSYCNKGSWAGNPISRPAPLYSHNVTALSAATYFTLLEQERLVDASASAEMKTWLRGGCITGLFPDELPVIASKCGIYASFCHDCAIVHHEGSRYVLAVLSSLQRSELGKYTQLCRDLDALIRESR